MNKIALCDPVCCSNSDYSGNPDSRRSVSGYIFMLEMCQLIGIAKLGGMILFPVQKQSLWCFLSGERNYVFHSTFEEHGNQSWIPYHSLSWKYWCYFHAQQCGNYKFTKHGDIWYKFINEDGIIKIIFTKSQDNNSTLWQKISGELYQANADKIIAWCNYFVWVCIFL